jgi:2-polyprenyl-6-methoxyphenol hydroxylase-like FAD-dependent oxidoreductase
VSKSSKAQTSVLIVGAGPTGLVLALWLKKRGIAFRIIDKSKAPGTTSRALAVQARTLEFYRQLGIAQQLIDAGVTVQEIILRRLGKIVARAKFGAAGKDMSYFPYLLFCAQDVHEKLLCDLLLQMGVVVERQTELLHLTHDNNLVSAVLRSPKGTETVTADYLCGSDGAHSQVRHEIKTDFPGGTYSQVFFVTDVEATGEMIGGVQISVSNKDFCIVMPIKSQNSVRLTGIVPQESENKETITFHDVEESVKGNTGLKVGKVNWFSSYHVHHRVAENFRDGRVFLAGDAGHIHSPAGGQGMNTGIGDAVNLAWKLADVIQGRCSKKLLDSYEPERLAFAKVLIQTTDTAFKIIANRSVIGAFFRTYFLPTFFAGLTRFRFTLNFMFKTISQIKVEYRESFLSKGAVGKIGAGDRLPWMKTASSDNHESLNLMDWQIHIYGRASDVFKTEMQSLKIIITEFVWHPMFGARGFKENAVYLIRPDGYIGLAAATQEAQKVKDYFSGI